jgi:hypothetical protein
MPHGAHETATERLASELGRLYGEVMGVAPTWVEVQVGKELVTAILYCSTTPAEKSLWTQKGGCRLLHDYHEACARGLFAPTAMLAERILGLQVANVVLASAPPTRHKILVLVPAPGPEASSHDVVGEDGT